MFGDEPKGYFPGGSVDTVWKPHPTHNDLNNHGLQNSKLSTWAPPGSRGNNKNDFGYDDASAKAAWNGRGIGGPSGGDNKPNNAWGPPSNADPLGADMLEQELMHMNLGKPPDGFGHGGGGQWGRQDINQGTPWNVDTSGAMGGRPPFGGHDGMHLPGRGFMQPQMHFDNEPTNQWRGQWDMDFSNKPGPGPDFGPPFGGMPMGSQFAHGRHSFVPQQQAYNDRMMHGAPHFTHGHRQPQQQPWMNDKFGNNGHHGMHHPMNGPNNGGRFPFGHPGQQPPHGGPPSMMMQPGRPPLMPMQPPHHNHHPGASVNAVPPSFAMGTFQPQVQNEDAVWQDPNGELRKWQRDTGTAHWGDPAKQNSSEIRRWIQPPNDSDEENLHLSDPLREGKDEESGWGPPPAPPGQKPQIAPPQPPVQPIGGGWSDGPRGPPQSNFAMAPGSNSYVHVPHANNGWSTANAPSQAAPVADWTRGGPPPFAAPPLGGFDFQPVQHTNDTEASKIATKLRLAVSKNLLDMNLLNSSGALTNHHLATSTLNMLNTMLNHVAHVEHLEARKEAISMDPSRKMEIDRINIEAAEVKAELDQYRDKIHNALSAPRGESLLSAYLQPQRHVPVSLADELASMDNLSNAGVDLSTPLGNEVGQLW